MGALLAKFRKEKTTKQVLEALEEKIQEIEKYSYNTQEQKKRIVGNFLAISIGIYVIAFLVFYFVYFPPTWNERIIYSIPLFLFPFIIIFLRRLFTWYFQRKLNKNSGKLKELREEKKKILEQVMDKETYKVAVKLLARFGSDKSVNKNYALTPVPSNPSVSRLERALGATNSNQLTSRTLNYSFNTSTRSSPLRPQPQPTVGSSTVNPNLSPQPNWGVRQHNQTVAGQELRRRTPFPIVTQEGKGIFDRIVDVLVGDGPQDRFAMICKECYGHNGMALKEDFEYTTFRCAFCNALNPSRKARPVAPRLPMPVTPVHMPAHRGSDDNSSDTSSDDESDKQLLGRHLQSEIVITKNSTENLAASANIGSTDLLTNGTAKPETVEELAPIAFDETEAEAFVGNNGFEDEEETETEIASSSFGANESESASKGELKESEYEIVRE